MAEHDEFITYLDLQGSMALLTKTELIERVRERGETISPRTLTYYGSQGLLPKAARIGSRAGAYPAVVAELLTWLIRGRKCGVAVEALRELVPLWQHLVKARKAKHFDLAEFQYLARQRVTSTEASSNVPWLVSQVLNEICTDCAAHITWLLKDGSTRTVATEPNFSIRFILAEPDEATGHGRTIAWTQLVLPGLDDKPSADDPATILLGIPNDMTLDSPCHDNCAASEADRAVPAREEVLI